MVNCRTRAVAPIVALGLLTCVCQASAQVTPAAGYVPPDDTPSVRVGATLFLDYTVNGNRSFFVSVNGGPPVEAAVSGVGNNTPQTTAVPVTLQPGANTIKVYNDEESASDPRPVVAGIASALMRTVSED